MAAAPPVFPQMDQPTAKEALAVVIAAFDIEENKLKIVNILSEFNEATPPPMKMMRLMPVVMEMQQTALKAYGFDAPGGPMTAMMQIKMHAVNDPEMAAQVERLQTAVMTGKLE